MTRTTLLLVLVLGAGGCTTLGPMPATTGLSAVPAGRPGVEAQLGAVPGYFLSSATEEPSHRGNPTAQLLALVEPDHWLGTRGLVLGAHGWGRSGDSALEPFLGYRLRIDDRFAFAFAGYGTQLRGAERGASYRATRIGGEAAVDARMLELARWLAVHGQAAVSTTYVDASGTYCASPDGLGVDCGQNDSDRVVDGTVHGVFAAATGTLAVDFGRLSAGSFHSVRLALLGAAGFMPQLRDGMETGSTRYLSLGLTLTLGLGSAE